MNVRYGYTAILWRGSRLDPLLQIGVVPDPHDLIKVVPSAFKVNRSRLEIHVDFFVSLDNVAVISLINEPLGRFQGVDAVDRENLFGFLDVVCVHFSYLPFRGFRQGHSLTVESNIAQWIAPRQAKIEGKL